MSPPRRERFRSHEPGFEADDAVAELRLPSSLEAPRDARAFARSTLASWGLADQSHTVELLTTELVANVVVHVDEPVSLRLRRASDALRVEVDDPSPVAPELQHPAPDETHGRGILLISTLASRWGAERRREGKTVWFELDTDCTNRNPR